MSEPSAFSWSFDRNPWDSRGARTFSVGIYQWLPKSSGKGVKKSKTIRVMGYCANPTAVYALAKNLCRRLNSEGVRIDQPPKWLQKQYSLPRPATVPPRYDETRLLGKHARELRRKIEHEILVPGGFAKCPNGTYSRKSGDQIHLINFQGSKYGNGYFVNLGFHYAFIPGFSLSNRHELYSPKRFTLLDCALRTRLRTSNNQNDLYEYGIDRAVLLDTLRQNAKDCLAIFDECSKVWQSPQTFLDNAEDTGGWLPGGNHRWLIDGFFWFAAIARHLGADEFVSKQRAILTQQKSKEERKLHAPYYEKMWKQVVMRVRPPN